MECSHGEHRQSTALLDITNPLNMIHGKQICQSYNQEKLKVYLKVHFFFPAMRAQLTGLSPFLAVWQTWHWHSGPLLDPPCTHTVFSSFSTTGLLTSWSDNALLWGWGPSCALKNVNSIPWLYKLDASGSTPPALVVTNISSQCQVSTGGKIIPRWQGKFTNNFREKGRQRGIILIHFFSLW